MLRQRGDGLWPARTGLGSAPEVPGGPSTRIRWSLLRELAGILVLSVMVSLIVKTLLVQAFFIPSGSMEPTLHGCPGCLSDKVLVNKLTGRMGGVGRGDVVVFHDPGGWLAAAQPAPGLGGQVQHLFAVIGLAPTAGGDLVKRVIGIGGDTVEARDQQVYVNGTRLDEPYVLPGDSPSEVSFRVTVPANTLWVMGDHRSDSSDSRVHQHDPGNGFVPVADVVGRAFAVIWPLNRSGLLGRSATFDDIAEPGQP